MSAGTVLVTGPTGGLGRSAVMAMARRPAPQRPDLLLVGREGPRLDAVAENARAEGAHVETIPADLAQLSDVRAAGLRVKELVDAAAVAPLRALVANAGASVVDTRRASADGYELTFAVNYLAHAQLIGDLLDSFASPSRVVLLGSNTYHLNAVRRLLGVPPAQWRDPLELATPLAAGETPTTRAAGVAYSNSKLALLYYAHELQRRAPDGVGVAVFEPGYMPGTGLFREQGAAMLRVGRMLERIPGISSPARSGPALASVTLDERWSHLRDGAFVVKTRQRDVEPFALDRAREARLWEATAELLGSVSVGEER
ncbi:SDR family NAD(P)-dependent oxidoreductase [Paramicrobacterium fandaimingii]|uniref:SDR family NAD(P)-dependent oxidoreductase n=1 Tax=Paramicrobacterium fandaimingii TaxID=2708079 RepID=UPI001FD236E9|nr:SDR family NAD(P)-dependent oxidoreductase [Microbacterium fandaimingii]